MRVAAPDRCVITCYMEPDKQNEEPASKSLLPRNLATAKSRARLLFLTAAFLSFVASVALFFSGDEDLGIFVGLWVPSILALGGMLAPAWRE